MKQKSKNQKVAEQSYKDVQESSLDPSKRHLGLSSGLKYLDQIVWPTFFLPQGTICEVAGEQQTSKSTLMLWIAAYNLLMNPNPNFKVLYMDFEKNLARQVDLAASIGLNMADPRFVYKQPNTLEGGCKYVFRALSSGDYDGGLVVMDTLAAACPVLEVVHDFEIVDRPMYAGKLWAYFFRKTQSLLTDIGPSVVMLNHLAKKVDMESFTYGPPKFESTSSGKLKFFAANRYFLTQGGDERIDEKDPYTGIEYKRTTSAVVRATCVKNKVAAPFGVAHITNKIGFGFSPSTDFVEALIRVKKENILEVRGAYYSVKVRGEEVQKIRGKIQLLDFLQDNPEILADMAEPWPIWHDQLTDYVAYLAKAKDVVCGDFGDPKELEISEDKEQAELVKLQIEEMKAKGQIKTRKKIQ